MRVTPIKFNSSYSGDSVFTQLANELGVTTKVREVIGARASEVLGRPVDISKATIRELKALLEEVRKISDAL